MAVHRSRKGRPGASGSSQASTASPVDIKIVRDDLFKALGNRFKAESNGKRLRRDLTRELRAVTKPVVVRARSGIMAMGSSVPHEGPSLRATIGKRIRPQVRYSGRVTGVRVVVGRTPALRNFALAGRYTNRDRWRRRVYGRDVWVYQVGRPNWFDNATRGSEREARQAVLQAVENMLQRMGSE